MYKGVNQEFEFHHRSLWDWIVKQVEDPKLTPHFHWDAQRLFKYNGSKWVRILEEPWAADMFWEVQVSDSLTWIALNSICVALPVSHPHNVPRRETGRYNHMG